MVVGHNSSKFVDVRCKSMREVVVDYLEESSVITREKLFSAPKALVIYYLGRLYSDRLHVGLLKLVS